jgi:hypothetical protein
MKTLNRAQQQRTLAPVCGSCRWVTRPSKEKKSGAFLINGNTYSGRRHHLPFTQGLGFLQLS